MKLNNIKQILLTAADISMVILNISLAPLKRFHPTRSAFYDVVPVTFTSPRPNYAGETLLKVFLNLSQKKTLCKSGPRARIR